mmetsp:Transcript_3650/g.8655  ORF Transcript_3650/g.8655 Transcript_3650/m.8655 type:complete len:190 (+) Transcript_3650:461-1030(+)
MTTKKSMNTNAHIVVAQQNPNESARKPPIRLPITIPMDVATLATPAIAAFAAWPVPLPRCKFTRRRFIIGNQARAVPTPHKTIEMVSMDVLSGNIGITGVGPIKKKDIAQPIKPTRPTFSPARSPCPIAAIVNSSIPLHMEKSTPVKDVFSWSCWAWSVKVVSRKGYEAPLRTVPVSKTTHVLRDNIEV